MHRQDAEARRDRLQQQDQNHTYLLSERSTGDWEVVRVDLARRIGNVKAERGKPAEAPEDPRPSVIRQIPPYGPGV